MAQGRRNRNVNASTSANTNQASSAVQSPDKVKETTDSANASRRARNLGSRFDGQSRLYCWWDH